MDNKYVRRVFLLGIILEFIIGFLATTFPMYLTSGAIITSIGSLILFIALFYYMKTYLYAKKVIISIILTLITAIPLSLIVIFVILYFSLQYASGATQSTWVSNLRSVFLTMVLICIFPACLSWYYLVFNRSFSSDGL